MSDLFRRFACSVALGICTILVATGDVHAYLDPGTGSYILQVVIAGIVGSAFALKLFWRRLKLFLGNAASKRRGRKENGPAGGDG